MASDLWVVLQSFVGNVDGADIQFHAGEPIPANHQAVKKFPKLFGPTPALSRFEAPVEQATAAPGEKRLVRFGKPKAAKAKAAQPEPKPIPEPEPIPEPKPFPVPESAPAGKAISLSSLEGK